MTDKIVSSKEKWKDFLTRYYKKDIQLLAVSGARTKSLMVDYHDLVKFDVRLAEELLLNPGKVLKDAEDAVPLVDLPVKKKISAFVRVVKLPKKTLIRDLRGDHVNTLVSIDCTVRNISAVNLRIIVAAFECARCGNIQYLPEVGVGRFLEPSYCDCNEEKKGVFRLLFKESTFEDYQRLRVQESPEDLDGGAEAQTLECNLNNDLVGELSPGDRVILNGIFRSVQKVKKDGKTVEFNYYMDVMGFERDEQDLDELVITPEDELVIKKLASSPGALKMVEDSVAPAIYGYSEVKRAIALQWFGGVKKKLPDGTVIRGNIHLIWLGDPAMGKSQVLEAAARKAPRGMSTGGQGVSAAGLTAATVPDDWGEGMVLEAGVLVLASPGGYVAIDEFDKMRADDRKKMHGAMEGDQLVKVDRAGIHATMRADCSILATGNPVDGRWDPTVEMAKQIDLDPAILSRFDLAFLNQDTPDEKKDRAIGGRILMAHRQSEEIKPPVDTLTIKKWIAYARRHVKPVITEEIETKLLEYYINKRRLSKDSTIKITARDLDGLVRLCEACAKLRLSPVVEQGDVDVVLELKDKSVEQTCTDANGNVDVDNLQVGAFKAQRNSAGIVRTAVRDLAGGRLNVLVEVKSIVELCQEKGLSEKQVLDELEYRHKIGRMWMPEDGLKVMLVD